MDHFIDYIENTFIGVPDDGTLYRYKRQLLDKMTERANAITRSGLQDEKVLQDLVISEFPDLHQDYQKFYAADCAKKKEKAFGKFLLFGSVGFVLLLTIVYLSVSFLTHLWSHTWLIMLGGLSLWIVFLLGVAIKKLCTMRRLFHPIARILLALGIMLIAANVFLICLAVFHIPNSWMVFLIAVIFMFASDAVFAAATKQALAVINYLLYIPAAMSLVYVLLGELGIVAWDPGWLLMVLAVLIDAAIVAGVMINNAKYVYKQEVQDEWSGN